MASNPDPAGSIVMKRKTNGKSSLRKDKREINVDAADELALDTEENGNFMEKCEGPALRKRPKRAASCSSFKEKAVRISEGSSVIETKELRVEDEEKDAVELTKLGVEDSPPCRKILDFVFHDADGKPQPFEVCEIDDIYITAIIMPMDASLEKEKERGVKCEGFGRIESWSISGYDEGVPVVWISTEIAEYECVKPLGNYRRFYNLFYEKARICLEVYRKLSRSLGGNPNLSLEELLAGVVRSISRINGSSNGVINRDFVISLGDFIFNQLIGLDETTDGRAICFATIPALCALREECIGRVAVREKFGGTLQINSRETIETNENEDEKLARLLQEEENWKLMRQQKICRTRTSQNIYIKISEAEIANDYPLPAYYKPACDEMDEYIFFDSDSIIHYNDLPRRVFNNWSLYNSDSRLISLELLPMKPCAETDVMAFGSGNMREDDGSGFFMEVDPGQSSSSISDSADNEGIPVYLSAIKEWMIEFGSSMIFISIRTDVAWYRLGKPAKQYVPWYEPVLKTARLAISIITLLKEQTRVSKLSFSDVIRKLVEFKKDHPAYISSSLAVVEKYVVVHGQIILQQFAEYPDEVIKKCAFVTGLSIKMEERRHTKLVMKKKLVVQKEANLNPCAAMGPLMSKWKAMRATTTRLINRIWADYYSNQFPSEVKEEDEPVLKDEEIEEENEDDDIEEQSIMVQKMVSKPDTREISQVSKLNMKEIRWEGDPIGKMDSGEILYKCAIVHGEAISIGSCVVIDANQIEEVPDMYFVEYLYERYDNSRMVHGRVLLKGSETVLGNAANEREVFLSNDCADFALGDIKTSITVDIRSLSWGCQYRKDYFDADKIVRANAEDKKKKGLQLDLFCRSLYWPERGAFFTLPLDSMGLGTGICNSCSEKTKDDMFKVNSKKRFEYRKIEYNVNDFIYVRPQYFTEENDEYGTFKAGRNVGRKAYVICHLLEIIYAEGAQKPTPESTIVKVRRFYRPEDISAAKAYSADIREVYYSDDLHNVPVDMIAGKCGVVKKNDIPSLDLPVIVDHVFFCEYFYDPTECSLKQLPASIRLYSMSQQASLSALKKNKGKEKCEEGLHTQSHMWKDVPHEVRLATLDIFAGCGGLSEGLQQSGVTFTKWAIEYEEPAGEAFSKNHPDTLMFIDNCNVILRAIMEKCGDADDCISTSEAAELASGLDEEKLKNLPMPGQVDFINGGPPCQGFSGMNRFNQSTWSKVQCEMILAFLSFAEYFRPKFFLLENVRNFVSFNKGQTFRLTLASLLEMGYQVRFGILEAGAYGVSQSRKRAFIWAASPQETLPEWPEPMHVFATPELKISLNGNSHYAAVCSTADGGPIRSITVKDTIGDLPPVENGASKQTINYGSAPVSWFQKHVRGNSIALNDHITKEMNELNLIRCKHIPKRPGADWRDLPDEKVKLSSGQLDDLIPWCLPHTALRHNQWKGLFGRVDWEGNFPTSITDPQPMGKVGMCFHPEQDRILTVREYARSQGFRDSYIFYGNIQNKYRQIGNAVPPPLAYALGRKLKEAVDAKKHSSA